MQVITIHNEKGGVGKSTIAAAIASGLAIKGYHVVIIDADQQGSLTNTFGIVNHAGFYNFIVRNNPKIPGYVPTRELLNKLDTNKHPQNLRVIAGNYETEGIIRNGKLTDHVKSFARRLNELSKAFDYVIIDTQPSATMLHDVLALISDWYIIPTDAEPLSAYQAVPSAVEHITFAREQALARGFDKAKLLGIIPNKFRSTTNLHNHIYQTLIHGERDTWGNLVLDEETGEPIFTGYGDAVWNPIPLRTNLVEGQLLQESLTYTAPHTVTSRILQSVIDRVEHITQNNEEVKIG